MSRTCKLCGHTRHETRCEEAASNAQFTCACPGECAHGKHPNYCADCAALKTGRYFIRHRVTQHRADVELVIAPDAGAAQSAALSQRLGYWTDDSKPVERVLGVFGPFASKEEAETSQAGWVEDV